MSEPDAIPSLRPGLTLGQRLLATGAAPDVVLQAWEEGRLEPSELNHRWHGRPLVEHWIQEVNFHASVIQTMRDRVEISLDWPVDGDMSALRLPLPNAFAAEGFWFENALSRLVAAGLDPLAPWSEEADHANLLEWANATERPWLLRTCLNVLPPALRQTQVDRPVPNPNLDWDDAHPTGSPTASRLHVALSLESSHMAQVWHAAGADLEARTATGETPIFFTASVECLRWALSQGADIEAANVHSQRPVQSWRRFSRSAEEWSDMVGLVRATDVQKRGLLEDALDKADDNAIAQTLAQVDDPACRLNSGTPALVYLAHEVVKNLGMRNFSNSNRAAGWSKAMGMLWRRTVLAELQTNEPPGPAQLTALEWANLATDFLKPIANQGRTNAAKKQGVTLPDPDPLRLLAWNASAWGSDPDPDYRRARDRVRGWAVDTLYRDAAKSPTLAPALAQQLMGLNALVDSASALTTDSQEASRVATVLGCWREADRIGERALSPVDRGRLLVTVVAALGRYIELCDDDDLADKHGWWRTPEQFREQDEATFLVCAARGDEATAIARLTTLAVVWAEQTTQVDSIALNRELDRLNQGGNRDNPFTRLIVPFLREKAWNQAWAPPLPRPAGRVRM